MKHKRRPRCTKAGTPRIEEKTAVVEESAPVTSGGLGFVLQVMIFLSGFACLAYQILWMRQLGLLFGNTSHAAALTLAVFFAGLAAGSWFWGRRCPRLAEPLRTYGRLELGIGAAGIVMLAAPKACTALYPMVYGEDGSGFGMLSFKLLFTLVMVFPAAFLMGGTIPVMGQHGITKRSEFGTTAARIYAVNTLGAATGAFMAAFVLIGQLGVRLTGLFAIATSVLAAVLAFALSRRVRVEVGTFHAKADSPSVRKTRGAAPISNGPGLSRRQIAGLAFLSGFNVLALEVLWTRMFAQVHENSVYSFSAVLIIVLVCLASGAWLASRLAAGRAPASQSLVLLTATGGAALCLSPFVFMWITGNLRMLPTESSLAAYVARLFATAFATIGPPSLLIGAVFPFLMKGEEKYSIEPGKSIGMLSAINTLGAIFGSLACGFLLLQWLGMWRTMQLVSSSYLITAMLVPSAGTRAGLIAKTGALVMFLLAVTVLDPAKLPLTSPGDSTDRPETLVETREDSDCTVSVVKYPGDDYAIKINSNYSLGSTSSYAPQMFQARIPLLAYPATDSVFFLGMGTGTTAGEALDRNDFKHVEKVVTCELSPGVVAASKRYFAGENGGPDLTNGLFHDPRSRILVEDGRNHLMGTSSSYAMINADLFLPYRSGAGGLYSLEHFQQVKKRLKPGGVFVQWLPLYQVSEREFGVVTRTMLAVFPQVSLWRCNFQPGAEVVALVGHQDASPVPGCSLDVETDKRQAVAGATREDLLSLNLPINAQTVLLFYCGNVTLSRDLFAGFPLNTDDKPVIEYGTPRSLHRAANQIRPHFVAGRFADLVDQLLTRTLPASDPMLANRGPENRGLPLAGAAFHRASIASVSGDEAEWERQWQLFLRHWSKPDVANESR